MTMKKCHKCNNLESKLFRCKYDIHPWVFLCQSCLSEVKKKHEKTYTYGGTWKFRK